MTDDRKELEEKAYGKPILFVPRHWTLYEWVKEQPGRSLRDKLFGVVKRAYSADYKQRGHEAMGRYLNALGKGTYPDLDYDSITTALCEACECYGRAGETEQEEHARDLLRSAVHAQYKQRAA